MGQGGGGGWGDRVCERKMMTEEQTQTTTWHTVLHVNEEQHNGKEERTEHNLFSWTNQVCTCTVQQHFKTKRLEAHRDIMLHTSLCFGERANGAICWPKWCKLGAPNPQTRNKSTTKRYTQENCQLKRLLEQQSSNSL